MSENNIDDSENPFKDQIKSDSVWPPPVKVASSRAQEYMKRVAASDSSEQSERTKGHQDKHAAKKIQK